MPLSGMLNRYRHLWLLLLLALVLRLGWWVFYVGIIENEGVEYARLAYNWFHGRGYVSIFGGTHTLFPPFYPLLIGLTAPLAGSEESAARLVALLGGLAVVAGGYLLALRVFGERIALWTGVITACHPLLIALSVSTYSENLYMGLAVLATLTACHAMAGSWRWALLTGILTGAAYLTRPEAVALAAGLMAAVAVGQYARHRGVARALGRAGLILAAAAVVAAPYVWHLSRIAGAFRWEGKSGINNRLAIAISNGLSNEAAGRGVGPEGEPQGVWLFKDQHALLAEPGGSAGGLLKVLFDNPVAGLQRVLRPLLRGGFLGAPLLLALILTGLLLSDWWKQKMPEGLALLVLPAVTFVVMLSVRWTWSRYYFALLGTGLIWAAAGAERMGQVVARLIGSGWTPARRTRATTGVVLLLFLAMTLQSGRRLNQLLDLSQTRDTIIRDAGHAIRRDAEARGIEWPLIASQRLAVAHYARGETVYSPYADDDRAIRFFRRASPDYVVVLRLESRGVPYAAKWLKEGPASGCLESFPVPNEFDGDVGIWRWVC